MNTNLGRSGIKHSSKDFPGKHSRCNFLKLDGKTTLILSYFGSDTLQDILRCFSAKKNLKLSNSPSLIMASLPIRMLSRLSFLKFTRSDISQGVFSEVLIRNPFSTSRLLSFSIPFGMPSSKQQSDIIRCVRLFIDEISSGSLSKLWHAFTSRISSFSSSAMEDGTSNILDIPRRLRYFNSFRYLRSFKNS